jgi:predicted TPR repeat methyltransferase
MQAHGLLQAVLQAFQAGDLDTANASCNLYLEQARTAQEQAPARIWQGVIALKRDNASLAISHFEAAYPHAKKDPQLLQQMALAHARLGDSERAENFYRSAIRLAPKFAAAHYNLGNLLQARREFAGARRAFEAAILHQPTLAAAHTNLANTLVALGEDTKAKEHYAQAIAIDPRIAMPHHGLALLLQKERDAAGAESHYRQALALSPLSFDISLDLADLLFAANRIDEALTLVEDALASETISADLREAAAFKRAQYRGESHHAMPMRMVEKLYAGMAGTFDDHLVGRLGYRVPQRLMERLADWFATLPAKPSVLDLGCGTGLFGALVRPYAATLAGVDLSADMLTRARERAAYDALTQCDVITHLNETSATFELIVATDVLIYIAPLPPLFAAVTERLAPAGRFAFSTETPADLREDFRLQPSGRYAHSEKYIEHLAHEARLSILEKIPTVIRTEKNLPVKGFVFITQKFSEK